MAADRPIHWLENPRVLAHSPSAEALFPAGIDEQARGVHRRIPGYRVTPLKCLRRLSDALNIGGIWVKDEAERLNLGSFKVLGGSFAIFQHIKARLNRPELTYEELTSPEVRRELGDLTFCAATDGNHGRGVAWAAQQLGFRSVIYVHQGTRQARIAAIRSSGAHVEVVQGTYDDAVLKASHDALKNGWQVVSDTSWEGYEEIPRWVMQGYATLMSETQEQLAAQGIVKPTHILVQAGVGSLAAAVFGFYSQRFGAQRPKLVVVEPNDAACLYHSVEIGDGRPHRFAGPLDTIMAGLACGEPNPVAWSLLSETANMFLRCPDYVAAKAMRVYGMPLGTDPVTISGESGAVTLGALMFAMDLPEYADLREALGLGPSSQVLLINTERNTDPDDFRRVVWEGGTPVPERYRQAPRGLLES